MSSPNLNDPNLPERLATAAVLAGGPFAEFQDSRKVRFLTVFALTGHLRKSDDAARISTRTPHQWRTDDPEFGKAYDEAKDMALGMVESAMFDRAINGVERLKFNAKTGEPYIDPRTGEPYIEREYPESSAQFLLKAKPEYGDRDGNGNQQNDNFRNGRLDVAAFIKEVEDNVPGWREASRNALLREYESQRATARVRGAVHCCGRTAGESDRGEGGSEARGERRGMSVGSGRSARQSWTPCPIENSVWTVCGPELTIETTI